MAWLILLKDSVTSRHELQGLKLTILFWESTDVTFMDIEYFTMKSTKSRLNNLGVTDYFPELEYHNSFDKTNITNDTHWQFLENKCLVVVVPQEYFGPEYKHYI